MKAVAVSRLPTSAIIFTQRYNMTDWSQVVLNVRQFAKTVWFHVPDAPINGLQMAPARNLQEYKARTLVEKKTVLNLLEAFA